MRVKAAKVSVCILLLGGVFLLRTAAGEEREPTLELGDPSIRYIPEVLPEGSETVPAKLEKIWRQGEEAFERGNHDVALRDFSEALEIDPRQPRTWNYIGGIHFVRGDFGKALLNFREAFALDPGDGKACNNIATAYERLGNIEEAEKHYLRAIEIDGEYAVPYRNLGVLYARHLDRPKMARTYWEHYLRLAPDAPDAETVREELRQLAGSD